MHWNINTAIESDRLAEIGAVIRTHAPALVGLNEVALGPAAFARQAKAWGFAHSLLLKTDGAHRFNLGLMATTPLERHPSTTVSPFFHGVLCAQLPAWQHGAGHGAPHACVTHLTPHSPAKRLSEAKALRRLLPAGPTLLLGDLNALSQRDAAAHRATRLRDRLAASGSWQKFSVGDELDYAPLQALTAADALRDLHSGGTPTVPTRRGGDPRHAAPMRLDYAHATPALLAICPGASAEPLTDERAGGASDHFPLLVSLCPELAGEGASTTAAAAAAATTAEPTATSTSTYTSTSTSTLDMVMRS